MGKRLRIKIDELLKEKNISLRELGRLTDINHPKLSKLKNQKRKFIYREHVEKIIDHLEITDMNKIFEVIEEDE